ncbi:MAG: J domain-containing protein [Deltaproteobacteria bacterium]|jgi:molecular chaperone DnaJ|nr:J domain-containing protein [Deltaproteobacteria bacterium]
MLSRSECFKVLGLDESAGPNAIKRSYRKLAFELHPDLHPDLPDASRRFQQLNEAYVMLMQEYANTNFAAGKRSTFGQSAPGSGFSGTGFGQRPGAKTGQGAGQARQEATSFKTKADARKAYEKAKRSQKPEDTAGAKDSQRPEGGYTWAGEPPSGKPRNAGSGGHGGPEGDFASSGPSGEPAGQAYQNAGTRQPGREEILKDLLNDPFARRVFEDIYSHVRHNAGKNTRPAPTTPRPQPKPKPKVPVRAKPARKSALESVGNKVADLAGGIKGWLRKQIDDEQTMFLPGDSLVPGARLRLKVQQGLSDEKKTIELTLPPEFAPGKPIRLKGLGRRLGGMQGDLYLRIYSNSNEE